MSHFEIMQAEEEDQVIFWTRDRVNRSFGEILPIEEESHCFEASSYL
jgi:hypothetical protein